MVVAVLLFLSGSMSCAEEEDHKSPAPPKNRTTNSNIEILHDHDSFVTTLKVQTNDGKLACCDLLCGLARARGYDDKELADILPRSGFSLDTPWALASIVALNRLSKPYMTLAIKRRTGSPEKTLEVGLNRVALLESKRRFKQRVRSVVTMTELRKKRPTIGLPQPVRLARDTRHLVISIHGFNAFAEDLDGMLPPRRSKGLQCVRFSYPNDQPIDASSRLLSHQLRQVARQMPSLEISLVTYSMGGLVARRVIEDPALDPGNVRRLIMIAVPNHGSELAQFAFAMDLWQLLADHRARELSFFYLSVEDGLAEAATDLQPDSVFLVKLNRAQRHPDVHYTIFLGDRALLQPEDVRNLRDHLHAFGTKSRWVRFFGGKLDGMIEDLDELVQGKGDGVVSLKSGRLEDVDDVVVLPFTHTSVLNDPDSDASRKVREGIAARLTAR
jgi:pimeloyl-ACP methyl ester carboxylesterase